jgi:glycosyltransferase involved in cell wall biosynthesis
MPSDKPLVSIVTPSFNQATFLEATLRSVLDQDYPHLEYLVIDGGSTDGSLDILRRYENRLARWISEADRGQADAVNKGLRLARGEIVAWLNSDDLYLPGAVSQAVSVLSAYPEVSMVYADGVLIDAHRHVLDWHRYRRYSVLDLLCFEVLLQPTVFVRRDALKAVGLLDESYELILDHELWVRLAAHSPIVHVPQFWAAERTHPEAKTMAAAARFADEARKLIGRATESATLGPLVASHRRRVTANLECFCGRRMIDAGRHAQALRFFARGFVHSPIAALRYWYKIVQAAMGAVGLEAVFLWYRKMRREFQHRGATLEEALRAQHPEGRLP